MTWKEFFYNYIEIIVFLIREKLNISKICPNKVFLGFRHLHLSTLNASVIF